MYNKLLATTDAIKNLLGYYCLFEYNWSQMTNFKINSESMNEDYIKKEDCNFVAINGSINLLISPRKRITRTAMKMVK